MGVSRARVPEVVFLDLPTEDDTFVFCFLWLDAMVVCGISAMDTSLASVVFSKRVRSVAYTFIPGAFCDTKVVFTLHAWFGGRVGVPP